MGGRGRCARNMSGIYSNDPQTYNPYPLHAWPPGDSYVTDCGWAGVSPGIKLSSLNLEALKVASSLGLCNSVLNYIACFCSLFSVNSHTQGHISSSSAFSWLHLCLRPRCVSTVVVHDKLLQLVECNCASIFPIYFMVVLPKLLPSFKNRWRNFCVSTP